MKYLDPTFWKFVVAFLAIILLVLMTTGYIHDYQETLEAAPAYEAK